ncbi:MAG: undecaprenyl-diphosphatase UppP [Blastocatellia bacterium]|nr:undecaprenyl-diphosphatase UppP [Blastocatellia bacterium]
MTLLQALILGIVQGLTEFLPISSTAHLTLFGRWLGCIDPEHPEQWTAFIAVMQLGTLIAVLIYFTNDIVNITREFILGNISYIQKRDLVLSPTARLGWYIIVGSLPIGIVGYSFKKIIEGTLTKNLYVISASLIILAIILFFAEHYGRKVRSVDQLTILDAIFVGFAQVLALIPGSSRSGTTMTAGLLMGLTRVSAAKFSFLLGIPAIGASGIYEFYSEFYKSYKDGLVAPINTALIVSTIAAAIVGYLSIAFLMHYLQTRTTNVFVVYRIALGVLILILLLTGKLSS